MARLSEARLADFLAGTQYFTSLLLGICPAATALRIARRVLAHQIIRGVGPRIGGGAVIGALCCVLASGAGRAAPGVSGPAAGSVIHIEDVERLYRIYDAADGHPTADLRQAPRTLFGRKAVRSCPAAQCGSGWRRRWATSASSIRKRACRW